MSEVELSVSVVCCGRSDGLFVEVLTASLAHSIDSEVAVVVVAGWVGVARAVDRAVGRGGGSVVSLVVSGAVDVV